jgi:CBS domain-containing protein
MCKIKEILRKKGPHFNVVSPNTKVLDALTLMQSENYSYVVVMDDDNYLGIMSERDYIHKIKVLGNKQETATVNEILNRNLPVVNFEEDLNRCIVLMNVYKTRYLPVFDEFEFKGVLTMNDLMTEILEEKKYDL